MLVIQLEIKLILFIFVLIQLFGGKKLHFVGHCFKKVWFLKIQIEFKLKRANMGRSYLHQNIVGTLDCHFMKGFFGRLRKAKVMSRKEKNKIFM